MMELRVQNICKFYGDKRVIKDLSFTLRSGIACVTGSSGAGKTTLTRILLGLERPDSGAVLGLENARLSAVFQEDRLLMERSAEENLRFVLGSAYDPVRSEALLSALGLPAAERKPVREFSGGMRRRVALARALLVPFDLLVLDEPFTGLDAENRGRAAACIRRAAEGKAVVLACHEVPAEIGEITQFVRV